MIEAPPTLTELEVSVFGPGTGECAVVHIGDGDWIVIDSCIDRTSGKPAALNYLDILGVDLSSRIRLVVATHWHDDHIQGLAEILRAARSAKLVTSAVYDVRTLTPLIVMGGAGPNSATKEYAEILDILRERQSKGERPDTVGPTRALANKKLLALTEPPRTVPTEVYALSPADAAFNRGEQEVRDAVVDLTNRLRPNEQSLNDHSVVLWLKVGAIEVLLGADLEHSSGSNEGWNAIITSTERPQGRARCFKVPHHGSSNAHCPDCWNVLLEQPIAIVTPYARSKLPRASDITRLCSLTPHVYLTSDPARYSLPRRDKTVDRTMEEMVPRKRRRALSGRATGHVRVRWDALNVAKDPSIELFHGALKQCR